MQITNNILLIRPANFGFNTETAMSNAFQRQLTESQHNIQSKVLTEFDAFVATLKSKGVNVLVFEDTTEPLKTDAVFPNNWVTFHANGTVILYPMYAPNRRFEKRRDILQSLKQKFRFKEVLDLSNYEAKNLFLEGTGSIIFDHEHRVAYACLSPRTDKILFLNVCNYLRYKPIHFNAIDRTGKAIYHTNVMMCIGRQFAAICLDSISHPTERELVSQSLQNTGHEIIDISFEQMNAFAGNMLEIKTDTERSILGLSLRAFDTLTNTQKATIEKYCELVPLSIPTIETIGGGSARCMMAEVFLDKK